MTLTEMNKLQFPVWLRVNQLLCGMRQPEGNLGWFTAGDYIYGIELSASPGCIRYKTHQGSGYSIIHHTHVEVA